MLAGVDQAIAALIQQGVVNLGRVSQKDDLCAPAHTGDDPLYLPGRQILSLIDDQPGVGDGAAPHEVHGFCRDDAGVKEVVDAAVQFLFTDLLLFLFQIQQDLQIVHNGPHEGGDLLLLAARQESDVLVKLGVGAADQELAVGPGLLLHHLFQAGGQGVEGFCRPGGAHDDDQRRLLRTQQQCLLHEQLAHAAGLDAEGLAAAELERRDPAAGEPPQHGLLRLCVGAQENELIFRQGGRALFSIAVHGIQRLGRYAFLLEGGEQRIRHIELRPASVEPCPRGNLIGGKVLRRNAHHLGLDAGHDVPGHQDRGNAVIDQTLADLQNAAA